MLATPSNVVHFSVSLLLRESLFPWPHGWSHNNLIVLPRVCFLEEYLALDRAATAAVATGYLSI